ncbi:MAG TPA: hypothetical protein VN612_02980 [Acidobacteriaceae bacterium]|nr:hypothetical protein [Acidobacteriaceae bacterium]
MPTAIDPSAWRQQLQAIATQPPNADLRPASPSAPSRCANPSCRRKWFGFLKDRRRPIFEDGWACTGHCLRALVDAAIRRESPAPSTAEREHSHRIPLGLILLSRGWVTQSQLHHALAMQRQTGGGRIGRWLIEECGVPEESVVNALALQWHCNVYSVHRFDPEEMALAAPREIIERTTMFPLRISRQGSLRVAFADRPDPVAAFALQRMTGLKVESGVLAHAEWKAAREGLLGCQPVRCSVEQLPDQETLSRRIASDIAGMQPRRSRLVRIHQVFWLRMWLEDVVLREPSGTIPFSREDMLDRVYSIAAQPAA